MVHLHDGVLYSRKKDILKFAGKCTDLENIILSDVTQTHKDKYHMYSFISGFRHKAKILNSIQITIPEILDNKKTLRKP